MRAVVTSAILALNPPHEVGLGYVVVLAARFILPAAKELIRVLTVPRALAAPAAAALLVSAAAIAAAALVFSVAAAETWLCRLAREAAVVPVDPGVGAVDPADVGGAVEPGVDGADVEGSNVSAIESWQSWTPFSLMEVNAGSVPLYFT